MPYAVTGSCPDCGAPIFIWVDAEDMENYPKIHYNCDCYKEKRGQGVVVFTPEKEAA